MNPQNRVKKEKSKKRANKIEQPLLIETTIKKIRKLQEMKT
jgi:hypothetical protein